jgi:hypothetical protein
MAAVGPLIGARKVADLARLAATCRQINSFIIALPLYKHYKLIHNSLKNIKSINILSNGYTSIREHGDGLHVYAYRFVKQNRLYNIQNMQKYYMWSIKKLRCYQIEYGDKIKIINGRMSGVVFYIDIKGPFPTWISKYRNILLSKSNNIEWIFHTV